MLASLETMSVYLASPLGFSEAGRHFLSAVLMPFVESLGYQVLDPWALTDPRKIEAVQRMPYGPARREAWRMLNAEIGGSNRAAIDRAHAVLAVLDGVDVRQRDRGRDRVCVRAGSSSSATGATSA